jgi:hypothetical protein
VSIVKDTIFVSKTVASVLHKLVPTFRKKPFNDGIYPQSKIPEFIFKLKPEEISQILRVMFSADGCICVWAQWRKDQKRWIINRFVELACEHPVIAEQVTKLLTLLGFHPKHRVKSKEEVINFLKSFLKVPTPDAERVQVPTG